MTAAQDIAEFVTNLRAEDLPPAVVARGKELVAHAWAVQLACAALPWSARVHEYTRIHAGAGESTVIRYGTRTSAVQAALVNGTFGHGFELDDNHSRTGIKGGCVVVPAAFAVAEWQGATGADMLAGLIAGYEVMVRMALAVRKGLDHRKAHSTGACGPVGAAAVASRVLGHDAGTCAQALAVAAATIVGHSEIPSSGRGDLKRLFGGLAASAGIQAALLADSGITGPLTTLDAESGWGYSFELADAAELTRGLGSEWEVLNLHYKPYAQDGYIQPMTQGLGRIMDEHGVEPDQIEEVLVGASRRAVHQVVGTIRNPQTLTDAQFSANFSLALFALRGGAGLSEYTEEVLADPAVRRLAERVHLSVDDEIEEDFQRRRPRGAKISVRLRSGERYDEVVPDLRHLGPSEVADKTRGLLIGVLSEPQADELLAAADALEEVANIADLAPLLVASAETPPRDGREPS